MSTTNKGYGSGLFGWSGLFLEVKNFNMLKAFAKMAIERDDFFLSIAGEDSLKEDMEKLAEDLLHITDRVCFFGV